jgi:MFS family permease
LIGTLGLRGSFLLTLVPGLLAALLFALLVRDPPQRSLTPALGQGLAATTGVGLNLLRNVLYTLAAFPIGLLSDRFGRRPLLAAGYGLAGLTFAGFAWLPPVIPVLAVLFALAGIFIAAEDTLEGALVADLLGSNRGLGYGILGTVNGVGNLTSSVVVGVLWAAFGVTVCFAYAATFER